MVLGLKQLKLAAGILAGLAKAGDQAGIATAIDLALKATDFGETLRKQDPVAVALRDVSAKLEEATRKALSGEFGADWENKPDLAATLAVLPDVLESYAPDTDAIFAENLDPERIARRATDAAEAAHDDLFRRNTVGERLLFAVVRQTYAVALANKDFALQMILRGQGETLNRLDKTDARISRLEELLSGNHPAARALQEIRDTLRPNVPDIQKITDEHLPGIVRRILEEARKPGADPADFSGAVRRALEQARVHIANLEFAAAAHVLDAQLAQIDAENRDRAREHAALLAERGRVAALQLRYLDAAAFHKQAASLMAFDRRAAWGHMMDAAGVLSDHGSEFGENQALHDAIAAYRMVLDLASRERVPLDWAMTQNNLGTALWTLGQRESGTARLEEAVAAYNGALEIFSASHSDYYETICYSNRERALALIQDRRK
jgi:tetratricopeptide (TPR) repeat protein